MLKSSLIDSALHVIKGAAQKVIGTTLTTGVYEEGNNGRLTVECFKNPTEEEIARIQSEINAKINENVPIENFEIGRTEAETKFGLSIYDKFPVPAHISRLKLVQIKDWNINCCVGNHVKTTGELDQITITHTRFRNAKNQLEISFTVGE